ncbi:MAG: DUF3987 domain-containing protein [Desulfobacterales bacterium]|nr:DUF3987 domain-containing protein [Desulfobacterales bacterium]
MATTALKSDFADPSEDFRAVLIEAGLTPNEVVADGVLRRCPTAEKPRSQNGWHVLYPDPPAGAYGDWATGISNVWSMGNDTLSPTELSQIKKEVERHKAEFKKSQAEQHRAKAAEAQRYLANLKPATADNPYLARKKVKPCAKLLVDGQMLIVPVHCPDDDQSMSYQRIDGNGGKKFMPGARVAGGYFAIKSGDGPILIGEGIATALSLHEATGLTVLVAFSAGNLEAVGSMARGRYPERQIILCADDDTKTAEKTGQNPGIEAAARVARAVNGLVAVPGNPGDFNDLHVSKGSGAVKAAIEAAQPPETSKVQTDQGDDCPEPMPLPDGLPPVTAFDFQLLPETLRPWAADIAEQMQCPPDYVAVAIMAALSAVVGRRIGIRPKESTDWTVTPNQWAMLIGRPGVLKSPAMEAALSPLKRLAAVAVDEYQGAISEYEKIKIAEKLRGEAAEKAARAALKKDPGADLTGILEIEKADAPTLRRFMANDTTAAALGELHRQNPNGLLVFRDELVSLLKMLDQEENAEARGFYLTGWNGDSPYTFDRITRGMNLHIPAVCLSLLGSTQPARIAQYVKGAVNGTGDDGLLQRFGLIVWPDTSGAWRDVDRWPDSEAKRQAHKVFERLAGLNPMSMGAKQDKGIDGEPEGVPYLRFDPDGLGLFREWHRGLEARLRSGDLHPAFESHLAKYRKLVPGLALIIHLANGDSGPVARSAVLRALAWAEYLETHAKRLYASVTTPNASAARLIVKKIRGGALQTVLTEREIYRPQWAGLADLETIKAGVKLLVDRDWFIENRKDTGGRPSVEYRLNPKTEGLR